MCEQQLTPCSNYHEQPDIFADLTEGFDCTNENFYNGALPRPFFSFTSNPRVKVAYLPDRYVSVEGDCADGFALNSEYCQAIGDAETLVLIGQLATLQARWRLSPNGKRGTLGYFDKPITSKLNAMGLATFAQNGAPRQQGYGLIVKAIENGAFDLMRRELLISGFRIRWHEASKAALPEPDANDPKLSSRRSKAPTRVCFECPSCGLKAYAKPTASLLCGACHIQMLKTARVKR